MTTKMLTGLLAKQGDAAPEARCTRGERLFQIAFGAVQWPWLLRSLYGGTQAAKQALLDRLELAPDALPHLGSWRADTYLLHRIADIIAAERPASVVELGSGATSLVIAKALAKRLAADEATIVAELNGVQGSPVDLGGYYYVDKAKTDAVMRPSATFNAALAEFTGR